MAVCGLLGGLGVSKDPLNGTDKFCTEPKTNSAQVKVRECSGSVVAGVFVSKLRGSGRGFYGKRLHRVVSLSKTHNPCLVLVQPRKTETLLTGT